MTAPSPRVTLPTDALLAQLREAGAAARDPVGWHYAEVLATRTRTERGPVQAQLLANCRPLWTP